MKRIGFFVLAVAIVVVIVGVQLIPDRADASIFSSKKTMVPVQGYTTAIVCSTFVNDPNTNKTLPYAQVIAPTGYWFDRIDVCNASANAAQTVAIRFWSSATDSTTLNTAVTTIYLASGGAEVHSFPIRCERVSLSLIADTDDVYVIGYTN